LLGVIGYTVASLSDTVLSLLRFQAAMMSMAYKEGLTFPPAALNKVIVAANQDIRQVWLHCYSLSQTSK